jgi:hypothetical protein
MISILINIADEAGLPHRSLRGRAAAEAIGTQEEKAPAWRQVVRAVNDGKEWSCSFT